MNRNDLKKYVKATYGIIPDTPFKDSPTHEALRHPNNKKWFGLILDVKREKLGLTGDGYIDLVNLKCDKLMIGSIIMNNGVFPAYHMNKSNWISVALDGSADDEMIKMLLDMSYELTSLKIKKPTTDKSIKACVVRIKEMEKHFNHLKKAIETNDKKTIARLKEILIDYYKNGLWLSDYQRDERGELPCDLKRGVLSQDGLYNLLKSI